MRGPNTCRARVDARTPLWWRAPGEYTNKRSDIRYTLEMCIVEVRKEKSAVAVRVWTAWSTPASVEDRQLRTVESREPVSARTGEAGR